MTILARELTVARYRSFDRCSLSLDGGVTILAGPNAAGKTNLIEALQLLTSGSSFRRPAPSDLVREGEESCALALRLEGEGRVVDLAAEVRGGRRSFSRNGKRCRAAGVRGVLPSVLFCPDDLDMVKRGARVRRDALDGFGVQLNESYAALVGSYERIVEQRNALLKDECCSDALLGTWDDSLAAAGASLIVHRLALVERLGAHLRRAYARIADGEEADVSYVSTVGDVVPAPDEARSELRERVQRMFAAALERARADELRRGLTLVGPHRDELSFSIRGRAARTFASQGQQRSLVLAWKVAEVEVARDILGRAPLLLLDDVMSELDASRRAAFMGFVADDIQTVITTTNLGYFDEGLLDRAKVVSIGG